MVGAHAGEELVVGFSGWASYRRITNASIPPTRKKDVQCRDKLLSFAPYSAV